MKKLLFLLLSNCYSASLVSPPAVKEQNIEFQESYLIKKAETHFRNGTFTVYYNPGWMRIRVDPEVQLFVFWHEIGHIQLNHLGEKVYLSKQQKINSEYEADCYAGSYLKNTKKYNSQQLEKIVDFLENEIRDEIRADKFKQCIDD